MASEQLQSSSTSTDKIPEPQKHRNPPLGCPSGMGFIASHAVSPLHTQFGGFFTSCSSRARCLPSTIPCAVTPDGHFSQVPAACSPGDAANPSPYGHHHILSQDFLSPTLPLGLGCRYPHFSGQKAASSTLSRKEPRLHLLQRVSFSIAPQPPRP